MADERDSGERKPPEAQGAGSGERERRRLRAEQLRRKTREAFETRTERWQAVGLNVGRVDRREARNALLQAFALVLVLAGVLVVFGFRQQLFPGHGQVVRYVTAGLLVIVGWGLARTAAKGVAPALFRRMEPGTAGTVGFLIRLLTIIVVVVVSLRIAGVRPETLAVGGAFTAVIVGLAAQQTLGNVFAGTVLLTIRPFKVGDQIRLQGGTLGGDIEGTVASLGLFHTTLVRAADRIMIPNSTLLTIAIVPLREPEAVEFTARFDSPAVTPVTLQKALEERLTVPLRRPPQVDLEEVDAGDVLTFTISATPLDGGRGAELAAEVLEAIRRGGGEGKTDPDGHPTVDTRQPGGG